MKGISRKTIRGLNYRDTMYRHMLIKDEKANDTFFEICNGLYGTTWNTKDTPVQDVTLTNDEFGKVYNDVAKIVDDKLLVFAEQQSTINEGMPYRMLRYYCAMMAKLVDNEVWFKEKVKDKLYHPAFYVFYNGQKDYPRRTLLRLSDLFKKAELVKTVFELEVEVINISSNKCDPILTLCPHLHAYSRFFEIKALCEKNGEKDFVTKAIEQINNEGLPVDYFQRNRQGVMLMFGKEFTYNDVLNARYSDGLEKGMQRSVLDTAKKLLKCNVDIAIISKSTGLSVDEIHSLQSA